MPGGDCTNVVGFDLEITVGLHAESLACLRAEAIPHTSLADELPTACANPSTFIPASVEQGLAAVEESAARADLVAAWARDLEG